MYVKRTNRTGLKATNNGHLAFKEKSQSDSVDPYQEKKSKKKSARKKTGVNKLKASRKTHIQIRKKAKERERKTGWRQETRSPLRIQ